MRKSSLQHIALYISLPVLVILIVYACVVKSSEVPIDSSFSGWSVTLKGIGTQSSPRAVDLNKDSILDIVIGAGKVEFQSSDSAVIAINGTNGELLWHVSARDQIFGSPAFKDITQDGIPDVFIGGRSAELMAINGANGAVIWEYFPQGDTVNSFDHQLYNFYNPQFIPDQNQDGTEDILIANGGFIKAPPHDPNRPPGKLMIIDSKNGKLIAEALMPDGKETYISAIVADFEHNRTLSVVFGTGGETLAGNLYKTSLEDILDGEITELVLLAAGQVKGFIAPPVLADITGDGTLDIIANAVEGRMLAINGVDHTTIWEVNLPGTEAYCSIAAGYFTEDAVPDFFTNYGIGIWPDLMQSVQFMVDGNSGEIAFIDSLGSFHEASPLAWDVNNDGVDEALFSINHYQAGAVSNNLMVFDFHRDSLYYLSEVFNHGANISSTPWVGDINQDGLTEIYYVHDTNPVDFFSLEDKKGIQIKCIATGIEAMSGISWGTYMGHDYTGIFQKKWKKEYFTKCIQERIDE